MKSLLVVALVEQEAQQPAVPVVVELVALEQELPFYHLVHHLQLLLELVERLEATEPIRFLKLLHQPAVVEVERHKLMVFRVVPVVELVELMRLEMAVVALLSQAQLKETQVENLVMEHLTAVPVVVELEVPVKTRSLEVVVPMAVAALLRQLEAQQ
jgi:hypothetical protein